jgi:hypothetical protein
MPLRTSTINHSEKGNGLTTCGKLLPGEGITTFGKFKVGVQRATPTLKRSRPVISSVARNLIFPSELIQPLIRIMS